MDEFQHLIRVEEQVDNWLFIPWKLIDEFQLFIPLLLGMSVSHLTREPGSASEINTEPSKAQIHCKG